MSAPSIQQYFPYTTEYTSWEDWNGNFTVWYGQEPIPHTSEDNWQETALHIAMLPTFAAYPVPGPEYFATWQEWANEVSTIINGPSH